MIDMEPEELELLVKARDLLNGKAIQVPEANGLLTSVAEGIKLVLRVSAMGGMRYVTVPDNPLIPNTQGAQQLPAYQTDTPGAFMPKNPRPLRCTCNDYDQVHSDGAVPLGCEVHGHDGGQS